MTGASDVVADPWREVTRTTTVAPRVFIHHIALARVEHTHAPFLHRVGEVTRRRRDEATHEHAHQRLVRAQQGLGGTGLAALVAHDPLFACGARAADVTDDLIANPGWRHDGPPSTDPRSGVIIARA